MAKAMLEKTVHRDWLPLCPPITREQEMLFRHYSETNPFYPKPDNVFKALTQSPSKIRVVIIGQDPYHGLYKRDEKTGESGVQATGLAFSVPPDCKKLPPSLRNMFKVLKFDKDKRNGDLSNWNGVLLLNASLTVHPGKANSHKSIWNKWTDQLIRNLSKTKVQPLVVLLWGRFAESKAQLLDKRHVALVTSHPSPLSARRGFLTSDCFVQANRELRKLNMDPIEWI